MYPVRPWLYVGKHRDTMNLPHLNANHIGAMLQLEEAVAQPGMHVLYLPIADGVPLPVETLRRGVSFLLLEHGLGRNVLIACAAGISRCVTFAIAALKETEGIPLLAAYSEIVQKNSRALPHPVLWQSLCSFYHENTPYIEVLRIYNRKRPAGS
ncbi:protein-tyrosine phosphatase family protein [Pontibacter russatus]|uniref:protein-tyrosine phosphatase family protein n=1 Tax=Pontibacter russatus TaxID=2694929 RepID=UPI001379C699|nr:dual specificity protein phosphatase [Pontibacter russatus]